MLNNLFDSQVEQDNELDNLLDLFFPLNWDKKAYAFNRDEKDMHPYSIQRDDNNVIITHNILGVDKKDLKVSLETVDKVISININGKTKDKITGKEYSVNSNFYLDPASLDINGIKTFASNGLLYMIIPKLELPKTKPTKYTLEVK